MSRHRHRNLDRGIKAGLAARGVMFRNSRHGKPQMWRGTKPVLTLVAPGTEGATRTIEPVQPGVIYPAGTVMMDGLVVVYYKELDVPCWVLAKPEMKPVVYVSVTATGTHGKTNTGGVSAGRKAPVKA